MISTHARPSHRPVVVFDLDGTVCLGDGPALAYAEEVFTRLHALDESAAAEARDSFHAWLQDAQGNLRLLDGSSIRPADAYGAVAALAADRLDRETMQEAYMASRARLDHDAMDVRAPRNLPDVLDMLAAHDIERVLLTNSPELGLASLLQNLGVAERFDQIIVSAGKPRRMPDHLRSLLGEQEPTQLLSIGDHYINDVAPALSLGCEGALLTGSWGGTTILPSDGAQSPDHIGSSIEDLTAALEGFAQRHGASAASTPDTAPEAPLLGATQQSADHIPVLSRVASCLPQLGPAERAVAAAILDDPAAVTEQSTQDLADRAGVSPASVVRACQRMGFAGYQKLRVLLARDIPFETRQADTEGSVLAEVRRLLDAISHTGDLLEDQALDASVEALSAAQRILVVGGALSGPVASLLAARLLRSGKTAHHHADPLEAQIAAGTLGERDVCVVLSASGANVDSLRAARAAQDAGALVIALQCFTATPLSQVADHVHVVATHHSSFGTEIREPSRLALAVTVEALANAVDRRLGEDAAVVRRRSLQAVSDHVDE